MTKISLIETITVVDYNEYLRVVGVMSDPKYYGSTVATPETLPDVYEIPRLATIPESLPVISFDHQGWSQQIRGAGNVWFLIRRLGAGRYVIAEASGRSASPVLDFPGILSLAATRVRGETPVTPLRPETITDYDRRTNFGAF